MDIYLVGGAVRDSLMGITPKDLDYVVTGSTPEEMISLGYKEVGAEFPVFLHPKTGNEFALARKEYKVGQGYKGFKCSFGPDVTLKEDLIRRDLTINSMAQDLRTGQIIDPFGGRIDLKNSRIRHTSDAFGEDPLRVLRAARFASQLGFYIDRDTLDLMTKMCKYGEVNYLTPERIWIEIEKAIKTDRPRLFFRYLYECKALRIILPELERLCGVPQKIEYHPEVCTWEHTMLVLQEATNITKDPTIRLAALFHDLGKGTTPEEELPAHHDHETRSADMVKCISKRLKLPNEYADLAYISAKFHIKRVTSMSPKGIVKMMKEMDAYRKPDRFRKFLLVTEADHHGHGFEERRPFPEKDIWDKILKASLNINNREVIGEEERTHVIQQLIHKERLRIVKGIINVKETD
jgi:tRNA nucleotidyltransferase (CCA-adding enzyme)